MTDDHPLHAHDDEYDGLKPALRAFEEMIGARGGPVPKDEGWGYKTTAVDHMGYREAHAAYTAVMALDWFRNYGPGYSKRLDALQYTLAERVDQDPTEDVVSLE